MDYCISYILDLTSALSFRLIQLIDNLLFGDDEERETQVSETSFSGHKGNLVPTIFCSSYGHSSVSSHFSANIHRSGSKRWRVNQRKRVPHGNCATPGSTRPRSFIRQVLIVFLKGVNLGEKLLLTSLRKLSSCLWRICIQCQGLLSRLRTTLRGSADDIGWLSRSEELPPVQDGTTRFMEVLDDVRNGIHRLPDTLIYLLIPGLFSNHSPLYFVNTKKFFSRMGLACHIAKIHSEASVERNSWELKQYIEELYWGSGKRVLLLGHSKGGVDAAAALSVYWPDLKDKVAGLALVQSPYGGTPVASDILREGQIADKETWRIMEFIICKIIKGDMRALEDLTYNKRKDFISKHRLPAEQLPLVSFHTEARIAPGVLATMSHIAHAELPWLPLPHFLSAANGPEMIGRLPVVVPIAAAMAACALHLKLRYGETSDGLVTRRDAEVPGSVVVRMEEKLDHAWTVYSTRKKDQLDADSTQMCEALLTFLVEVGKQKLGNTVYV